MSKTKSAAWYVMWGVRQELQLQQADDRCELCPFVELLPHMDKNMAMK